MLNVEVNWPKRLKSSFLPPGGGPRWGRIIREVGKGQWAKGNTQLARGKGQSNSNRPQKIHVKTPNMGVWR